MGHHSLPETDSSVHAFNYHCPVFLQPSSEAGVQNWWRWGGRTRGWTEKEDKEQEEEREEGVERRKGRYRERIVRGKREMQDKYIVMVSSCT